MTLKMEGRAFRNIGNQKYMTVKSAMLLLFDTSGTSFFVTLVFASKIEFNYVTLLATFDKL